MLRRWLRRLSIPLRTLVDRRSAERDLDAELRFHLDMEAAERVRKGADPRTARTDAARLFGGVERTKDDCRDERGASSVESAAKDVRYALRALRRNPAFTVVAVLTLALGIGANTALFSVVNGVLLRPLPYPQPSRLVALWNSWDGRDDGPGSVSPAEYFDYLDGTTSFARFGVYAPTVASVTGDGEPERVPAAALSADVLPALGVAPAVGRVFTAAEDRASPDVVVLGHGLWQRRFGASRDVIGRRVIVNGIARTVVGVMPGGFRLPDELSATTPAELFLPLGLHRDSVTIRGSHYLSAVARLKPGVSAHQAGADVGAVVRRLVAEFSRDYPTQMRFSARIVPLLESVVGDVRPVLFILLGAVGFVLLIACTNVANLLLSRAEARRREMAVRTALGAARATLVRQLLVESVVLALAGGALGVAVAVAGTRVLVALRPPDVPRLDEIGLDGHVLLFALVVSTVVGALFGLLPALQATRLDVQTLLRDGGRETSGVQRQAARRALVVGEVAVALVLLTGAGLMTTSFVRLLNVDPGFRVDRLLTVPITLPAARYPEPEQVIGFFRELTRRASALPGATIAGAVAGVPLVAERGDIGMEVEGRPLGPGERRPRGDWQVVTPGYFRAMGMRMVRGREIAATDLATTPGVVVINEALAGRYWSGEDPIGRRFKLGGGAGPGWVTIVGIVGNVRHAGLGRPPEPEMYLAHTQFRFWGGGNMLRALTLVVRTTGEPAALGRLVRGEVRALDPQLPVGTFRTMEEVRGESVSHPRFLTFLFSSFSAVALAIAVIGVYGVMAYAVAQRRKEIAIRVALGARPGLVTRMVVGQGMALAACGVALGLAAALGLTRFLTNLLFETTPTDAATLALVTAVLAAAAFVACYVPARRATRMDPVEVLRGE